MFASEKEQKFFCDWYYRAQLDENFDSDRKFFYFYALFNHLFTSYADTHKASLKNQGINNKRYSHRHKQMAPVNPLRQPPV